MEKATSRATTSTLLFGGIAAGVYATSLALAGMLGELDNPRAVAAGMTLDMVLVVPLAFYLAVVRRHRLSIVTLAPVLVASFVAAALILPDEHQQALDVMEWLALPLELGLAGWLAWRAARALRKAGRDAQADLPERLHAAALDLLGSDRAASVVATEISVLHYAVRGWGARPHAPGGASAFSHHRLSGHGPIVFSLLPLLAAETFAVHVLLSLLSVPLAWLFTIASAYTMIWLVADTRATVLRPVLVDDEGITLRAGLRWALRLSWSDVAGVKREKPDLGRECLSLNLLGSPTHWLVLRRPVQARGMYGLRRSVRAVGLQPDDPAAFERALRAGRA